MTDNIEYDPNILELDYALMAEGVTSHSEAFKSDDILQSNLAVSDLESTGTYLISSKKVAVFISKKSKKRNSELHDT